MGPGSGMGLPPRNLAAQTGTSVRLMTIDTSTAMHSAQLSEVKNWPYTPTMNASGTNTSTVVRVEPTTAPVISPDAESTASGEVSGAVLLTSPLKAVVVNLLDLGPTIAGDRWRAMFSMTTSMSSVMRPIAT